LAGGSDASFGAAVSAGRGGADFGVGTAAVLAAGFSGGAALPVV